MERRTIEKGVYAGMQYGIVGEGPLLVLVHGFAEDNRIWDPILALGLTGFTCLLPQLPGTGESPLKSESISITDMADALLDMIAQETTQPCILLGHSMGGYIAAAFADRYPSWLLGLGLIHSSVYADDDTKKANRDKGIKIIKKGGKAHFFQQLVPALYSVHSQETNSETIKMHLDMAMAVSDHSVCTYYRAMRDRPDRSDMLRSIKVPVLFVLGAEDQSVPLALGIQQSTLPACCMIEVLPKVGHTAMNEAPQILLNILNKFGRLVLAMKK